MLKIADTSMIDRLWSKRKPWKKSIGSRTDAPGRFVGIKT
jgi:hypothetical protein